MTAVSHSVLGAQFDCNLPIAPIRRTSNGMFLSTMCCSIALSEVASIAAGGSLSFAFYASTLEGTRPGTYFALVLLASCLFPLFAAGMNALELRSLSENSLRLPQLIAAWVTTLLVVVGITYCLKLTDETSRGWVAIWFASAAAGLVVVRLLAWRAARLWRADGRFERVVVVIGAGEHGQRVLRSLREAEDPGLRMLGYFDDRAARVPDRIEGSFYLGTIDDFLEFARDTRIDDVFIALPWSAEARILEIVRKLRHLTTEIHLAPEMISYRLRQGGTNQLCGVPMLKVLRSPISHWGLLAKETNDRLLAALLLLLLGPAMILLAVIIKVDSRGPVFFRQRRLGFDNKRFYMWKFRTMYHEPRNLRAGGAKQATKKDQRVTPIGRFLRRTSLDELPQLFNVLRGDMSLVGPRPHPIWARADELWADAGASRLEDVLSEYAARHRVKPGLTGWAQVCGHRGATETVTKMKRRLECDLYYIENWSWKLDMKILFMTIPAAISRRNAY